MCPIGEDSAYRVPKKDLVSTVAMLFQDRRIEIAAHPLWEVLKKELENFRVKINISTATETFEAWRERDHDDLVLAVALAAWMAEPGPRHHFSGLRARGPAAHVPLPPMHATDWVEERMRRVAEREGTSRRRLFGR
jgi:hypothetical protein